MLSSILSTPAAGKNMADDILVLMEPENPNNSPVGPVVGIVIIVLVLLAGGIYFLLMESEKAPLPEENTEQASL